ncbi:MAG: acyl carrier protein [Opitutales bacterium]
MKTSSVTLTPAAVPNHREDSLRRLPAGARAAFARFLTSGDPATLDPVLFAILEDFMPRTRPLAELPGDTRLIDDLGLDSLSLTELVFFTEDLFGISITNEEIVRVRTLDDLRGFIHGKVDFSAMS